MTLPDATEEVVVVDMSERGEGGPAGVKHNTKTAVVGTTTACLNHHGAWDMHVVDEDGEYLLNHLWLFGPSKEAIADWVQARRDEFGKFDTFHARVHHGEWVSGEKEGYFISLRLVLVDKLQGDEGGPPKYPRISVRDLLLASPVSFESKVTSTMAEHALKDIQALEDASFEEGLAKAVVGRSEEDRPLHPVVQMEKNASRDIEALEQKNFDERLKDLAKSSGEYVSSRSLDMAHNGVAKVIAEANRIKDKEEDDDL